VVRRGKPIAALVPPADVRAAGGPAGLASLAGLLADWEEFPQVMEEIIAARTEETEREVPPLDVD